MSAGRRPVARLGEFALVWAGWSGAALVSLWVHPLGFGEFSGLITAVTTAFALAVCLVVGARDGSFSVAVVAWFGAVAGLVSAWGLTIAIEARTPGDAIGVAWFLVGCLAASAAALGVTAHRLVGAARVTR